MNETNQEVIVSFLDDFFSQVGRKPPKRWLKTHHPKQGVRNEQNGIEYDGNLTVLSSQFVGTHTNCLPAQRRYGFQHGTDDGIRKCRGNRYDVVNRESVNAQGLSHQRGVQNITNPGHKGFEPERFAQVHDPICFLVAPDHLGGFLDRLFLPGRENVSMDLTVGDDVVRIVVAARATLAGFPTGRRQPQPLASLCGLPMEFDS
mmetsp:Transcript_8483/g.25122  ORF Transcript_8483/g.25122 Transcript_8483/m.25122 type:complete len:203 (+) Transcript_8483:2046-2654(+)